MTSLKLKNSFLGKVVAVSLIAAFSLYGCDMSFAMTAAEIASSDVVSPADVLSVEDIGIAIDAGTIRSKFSGDTGKTIIHIQDAHCNFEAQSNISRILEQLSKDSGVDMISVEGAEGTVDTAWFRAFPDAEIRREVATYFMKKGEITGAEFFSINGDYDGTIFGAETKEYYITNLRAFLEVYPYKDSILEYLNDLRAVGEKLKSIVYPPALKELDRNVIAFGRKEIDLSKYAEYLDKAVKANNVDSREYVDFAKLINTLEYEKKIDFEIVDGERTRYIDDLSKILSRDDMAELVARSIKFKKGYIKSVEFYAYLRDLARIHEIPIIAEYPNLFYYYIYAKIYDGIDIEGLFKEIDLIERALKEKLIEDETQYKLDKFSEKTGKLIGLVNIELTNDDYDRFSKIAGAFSIDDVVSFYNSMAARYNLNYLMGAVPEVVRDNLPKMVEFYEIAMKRDMALVENTLAQMEKAGKDRSVLIAGGFHTRGMVDILEKRGVSYVVVTPKITKEVESPYIKVLTNQRTSIEDIITESAMPGTRMEASRDTGGLLSPLLRFGWGIPMLLDPNDKALLEEISRSMAVVEDTPSFEDTVLSSFQLSVKMLADRWLNKVKENMVSQLGKTEDQAEAEFRKFVDDDNLWAMLHSVFIQKYRENFEALGITPSDVVMAQVGMAFEIYRKERTGSATMPDDVSTPGRHPAGERVLKDNDEMGRFDKVIRQSFDSKKAEEESFRVSGLFGNKVDSKFRFFSHEGFNDALEVAKLPANVHPGRGGERKLHKEYQAHIDKYVYDNLNNEQKTTLANHELTHLVIANAEDIAFDGRNGLPKLTETQIEEQIKRDLGEKALSVWTKWENFVEKRFTGNFLTYQTRSLTEAQMVDIAELQEEFVNGILGSNVREVVVRMNSVMQAKKDADQQILKETLERHAAGLSKSAEEGVGPDVVIVVAPSDDLAKFWENRLSGTDKLHGSGAVIKKDAIVLSVSETNWEKGAGNGLGTLNGYVQAARKAQEKGLIRTTIPADKKDLTRGEITELVNAFDQYLKGKSAFMFHTAGKGTRTAPMPGVEGNSKPNIKLPEMVIVEGQPQPITILEAVIRSNSGYAATRTGRLGVFWGDQVIINQNPFDSKPTHHVEIFGQNVPLDESIKSYGVLIAGDEAGDALQREKISQGEVEAILAANNKGPDQVYKSIGSFTISHDFLKALLLDNIDGDTKSLASRKGSMDTDPDWWQPLTSTLEEYKAMMKKKGKSEKDAEAQWNKMNRLWNGFDRGDLRKFGVTDVGKKSLWWDYGQNKYYLANMRILTEKETLDGISARKFFGIDSWIKDSILGDTSTVEKTVIRFNEKALAEGRALAFKREGKVLEIWDSIVQNSTIKRGRLINCVVIDSYLEDVEAENAVIIGSTIFKLNAQGALVYNAVGDEVPALTEGQILTNVFHPREGQLQMQMRTDVSRDGSVDWEQEVFVYDNLHTYADVAKLMSEKGVTPEEIKKLRDAAAEDLKRNRRLRDKLSSKKFLEALQKRRNEKARQLRISANELRNGDQPDVKKAGLNELWAVRAAIDKAEARKIVAYRMMVSEGKTDMSVADYLNIFEMGSEPQNIEDAEKELNAVRELAALAKVDRKKYYAGQEPLSFGTSGLRDTVERLTDMEVYINTRGFIKYLIETGELNYGDSVAVGGDLRPSTPRLMTAVARAIEDEGLASGYSLSVDLRGYLPSPSVALDGFLKHKPSIMVTGSHIPADRNGIKFNKKSGEVLKQDEKGILAKVREARAEEIGLDWQATLFNKEGRFKSAPVYDLQKGQEESIKTFVERYTGVFGSNVLKGKKVFIYQHSAVGRAVISQIYRRLGADVITPGVDEEGRYIEGQEEENIISVTYTDEKTGRKITEPVDLYSEKFVPVDTEKVSNKTKAILREVSKKYKPDVIISTDGDSDRPLFADENGNFLVGDKLGLLVVKFLEMNGKKPAMVALPESTNEGVVSELEGMGIKVVKTKIGSPHVIKAMNDWTRQGRGHEKDIVCGWEANGGFLLGSDLFLNGKEFKALPTRDAVFPILAGMLLADAKNLKVSEVISQEIRPVYNAAGVFDDFRDLSGKKLVGNAGFSLMKGTIAKFSPKLRDKSVTKVNFEVGTFLRRIKDPSADEGTEDPYFFETEELPIGQLNDEDFKEMSRVKDLFESTILTKERGFTTISAISVLDGIKIYLDNGREVSHFRPSGNAPEFRNYTTASDMERAEAMLKLGLSEIVPSMVKETLKSPSQVDSSAVRWTPGRQAATADPTPSAEWRFPFPVERGSVVPINGEDHTTYSTTPMVREFGDRIVGVDRIEIYGGQNARVAPVIEGRAHTLSVTSGTITLTDKDGPSVTVNEGEKYLVEEGYKNLRLENDVYNMVNPNDVPAVVEVVYEMNERETRAYATLATVEKYAKSLAAQKPIMVHAPQMMFSTADEIRSRIWIEDIFRSLTNQEFRLTEYSGKQHLAERTMDDMYEHVVVGTGVDFKEWTKDDSISAKLSGVRLLPIDKSAVENRDKGWEFALEAVSWAVIAAAMTPKDVFALQQKDYTNPAADIYKFLTKVLKRDVDHQDLYTMLPFKAVEEAIRENEITIDDEFMEKVLKDLGKRITNLVDKILFQMPIKAFDPMNALKNRLRVMWSV
jgi:phosphomannomutase